MKLHSENVEVAIIGAGPVGLMAALDLSKHFSRIVLIGPSAARDGRTTAIWADGITLLNELDIWPDLKEKSAALQSMRIVDGTRRLIRAPEALFEARELDLSAFGYNMANNDLLLSLQKKVDLSASIEQQRSALKAIEIRPDKTKRIYTKSGKTFSAALVIAADGRNSLTRNVAGIKATKWAYPQTALVANLNHTKPHNNISTEFHTKNGPFTLVPLPGNSSSLVWVDHPETISGLQNSAGSSLNEMASEKSAFLLGDITLASKPSYFPLSGLSVTEFARHGILLVGESGHVLPPIGAQGLNLGIRDIIALNAAVKNAKNPLTSQAIEEISLVYSDSRRLDVRIVTRVIDTLNRSLLSEFIPFHLSRGLAVHALNRFPAIRNLVMRKGLAGSSSNRPLSV